MMSSLRGLPSTMLTGRTPKPIALFSMQLYGAGESHGKLSQATCIFYELRLWMGTRNLKVEDLA